MESTTDTHLLELLRENARMSLEDIGRRLDLDPAAVGERLAALEKSGAILAYTAVIDPEQVSPDGVTALIEIKITPERDGGFDRIAQRIARFSQVQSCYLMSGRYDLFVTVSGPDLREVARFVSESLSSIAGVVSTSTHFRLKVYKEGGFLHDLGDEADRLAVTP